MTRFVGEDGGDVNPNRQTTSIPVFGSNKRIMMNVFVLLIQAVRINSSVCIEILQNVDAVQRFVTDAVQRFVS